MIQSFFARARQKPKRRSFQIHLFTIVIIALGAGALLWLEMRCRSVPPFSGDAQGWPFQVRRELSYTSGTLLFTSVEGVKKELLEKLGGPEGVTIKEQKYNFIFAKIELSVRERCHYRHLFFDVGIVLAILIILAASFEFMFRRASRNVTGGKLQRLGLVLKPSASRLPTDRFIFNRR